MKVYDVFTYFDEERLLELRLEEHNPFVDRFVLVEGNRTFVGRSKPFNFDINSPRWANYRDKIIHLKILLSDTPETAWANEAAQRNAFVTAIAFDDDDIVHLSDVDEITSRHSWRHILDELRLVDCLALRHRFFYYFLNLESSEPWTAPRLMRAHYLKDASATPDEIRKRACEHVSETCGWHFSYLMTLEEISAKLASFSHQEFNNAEYNSPDRIRRAIAGKTDLFSRSGVHYDVCRIDNSWPIGVLRAPNAWAKYICRLTTEDRLRRVERRVRAFARWLISPLRRAA